jgi:signal transduction histidine kinase
VPAAALVALAWGGGAALLLGGTPGRAAAGAALIAAAPWLARGAVALDLAAGRALLGTDARADLAKRVAEVELSRAGLVAAADAERRRIERDLHDGMQQRLVALAMDLGVARDAYPDAPEPLRAALGRTHDDAKQALADLRHIVRGLYPAVLDDRGLDAALSGIAARSPVPARLRVELPRRPPRAIEAAAYFVVAEALANVAKHARATRVGVDVRLDGSTLHVRVSDDGVGGARPGGGTGLLGLAQRVASLDGTMTVTSPAGGPTTIAVELPCAS